MLIAQTTRMTIPPEIFHTLKKTGRQFNRPLRNSFLILTKKYSMFSQLMFCSFDFNSFFYTNSLNTSQVPWTLSINSNQLCKFKIYRNIFMWNIYSWDLKQTSCIWLICEKQTQTCTTTNTGQVSYSQFSVKLTIILQYILKYRQDSVSVSLIYG